MNHFFALTLSEETTRGLTGFVERWKLLLPPNLTVRWNEPTGYHLTLNFLGDLARINQPRLIQAVRAVPQKFQPFTIHLSFTGAFPNAAEPGILWAGLSEKKNTMLLSKAIDKALSEHGFAIEKHSYIPHISLGRCSYQGFDAAPKPLQNSAKIRVPISLDMPVTGFVLLETMSPQQRAKDGKARYNIVHTFPFGNTHS